MCCTDDLVHSRVELTTLDPVSRHEMYNRTVPAQTVPLQRGQETSGCRLEQLLLIHSLAEECLACSVQRLRGGACYDEVICHDCSPQDILRSTSATTARRSYDGKSAQVEDLVEEGSIVSSNVRPSLVITLSADGDDWAGA